MKELFIIIIAIIIGIFTFGTYRKKYDNISKKRNKKSKEEYKDELKNKTPDDIIDNLDNTDDISGVIDSGKIRLGNRLKQILQRFGDKRASKRNNSGSK